MHRVVAPPFRHMALDAVGLHWCLGCVCIGVATPADGGVEPGGVLAARNKVRIMARGACHPARTEADRHTQPESGVYDLEPVVVSRTRRIVEIPEVSCQRFTWLVGKRSAIVAREFTGHAAGSFEVTLQARLQLAIAIQSGGIDDRSANPLRRGFTGARGFDVGPARSVAALAIDTFRNPIAKGGIREMRGTEMRGAHLRPRLRRFRRLYRLRVGVVA